MHRQANRVTLFCMVRVIALSACLLAVGVGCGSGGATSTAASAPAAAAAARGAKTIVTGLQVPWGIAFLPNHHALIAERTTGRIVEVGPRGGKARQVMKVPGVAFNGEGGLLGLAVSPHYSSDHLVYAYMTTARDNRIVRFKLGGALHPILTGLKAGPIHNGGRIAFGPDGMLYAGVGETGDTSLAQDLSSRNGKILRITPNGKVPKGNPFKGSPIWSYGHRNVQGLAWDSAGRLWASEFGQNTFDEVNLIQKGHDYGWPIVEGKGDTQGGKFTNPKVTWRTSEASPSGAAILGSSLYIGTLQGQRVYKIPLKGTSVGTPQSLLTGRYGRLRTVIKAPDGSLWISTSNRDGRGAPKAGDDRIIRLVP